MKIGKRLLCFICIILLMSGCVALKEKEPEESLINNDEIHTEKYTVKFPYYEEMELYKNYSYDLKTYTYEELIEGDEESLNGVEFDTTVSLRKGTFTEKEIKKIVSARTELSTNEFNRIESGSLIPISCDKYKGISISYKGEVEDEYGEFATEYVSGIVIAIQLEDYYIFIQNDYRIRPSNQKNLLKKFNELANLQLDNIKINENTQKNKGIQYKEFKGEGFATKVPILNGYKKSKGNVYKFNGEYDSQVTMIFEFHDNSFLNQLKSSEENYKDIDINGANYTLNSGRDLNYFVYNNKNIFEGFSLNYTSDYKEKNGIPLSTSLCTGEVVGYVTPKGIFTISTVVTYDNVPDDEEAFETFEKYRDKLSEEIHAMMYSVEM